MTTTTPGEEEEEEEEEEGEEMSGKIRLLAEYRSRERTSPEDPPWVQKVRNRNKQSTNELPTNRPAYHRKITNKLKQNTIQKKEENKDRNKQTNEQTNKYTEK